MYDEAKIDAELAKLDVAKLTDEELAAALEKIETTRVVERTFRAADLDLLGTPEAAAVKKALGVLTEQVIENPFAGISGRIGAIQMARLRAAESSPEAIKAREAAQWQARAEMQRKRLVDEDGQPRNLPPEQKAKIEATIADLDAKAAEAATLQAADDAASAEARP